MARRIARSLGGDTLVVETRNFTDKVQSFRGAGTGKTLHLVGRFTRVDKHQVDYRFTVDDPTILTKPVTVLVPTAPAGGRDLRVCLSRR